VVRFAGELGWCVEVVDDRREFLSAERFPRARRFVHVDGPAEAARAAGVDRRTHVMVMSHNYLRDRDYLRSFFGTEVAYIGMLGPRSRLERLLSDLAAEGAHPSEDDLAKIHGPAGLDVGAEAPEEIAWAIVAETLAVRRRRGAGFLRDRRGPIHERPRRAATAGGAG
jgi:xanthine dehydrogenase accessory factor